jgi:hypothetical protein
MNLFDWHEEFNRKGSLSRSVLRIKSETMNVRLREAAVRRERYGPSSSESWPLSEDDKL